MSLTTAMTKKVFQVKYQHLGPRRSWLRSKPEVVEEQPSRLELPEIEDDGDHHIVQIRVADTDVGHATIHCDWLLLDKFGGEITAGDSW